MASEQQAAADMSSSHQQDVGQFDQAQASRVTPQETVSTPQQEQQLLDVDLAEAEVPIETSSEAQQPAEQTDSDANGGEQNKKKPLGRPKTAKAAAEPKPKTPGKPGRPRKAQTSAKNAS